MNRYRSIVCSVVFVGWVALPIQASAASITETKAAIGKDCVASGEFSTAMGSSSTASGRSSTAMGNFTTASGFASTAMNHWTTASGPFSTAIGFGTTAAGDLSFAGGTYMQLTDAADGTFVWGHSDTPQAISTANAFLIFPAGTPGKVGIGTPTPGSKLHVKGNGWPESFIFLDTHGADQDAGIRFYENASIKGHLYHDATNNILKFDYEGNSDQLVLGSAGGVGIHTKDLGWYSLVVNGLAAKTAGGTTWLSISDGRLKDITGEYTRGLDAVTRLRPVTFYYKPDNPKGLPTDEENIGFIAQEVQEVFPEAVNEGPDGYLDFNMHPVNVALVNAVKELKAENEALREEICQIKAALGM